MSAVLEWVKAVGLGSIIGVFVGARLTRQSQDRQFLRQAVAQRVDRARTVYQEALILGHRLSSTLTAPRGGESELPTREKADQARELHRELFEATVRLSSEGAIAIAHQYSRAMTQSQWLCAMIEGEMEVRPPLGLDDYWRTWHNFVRELDAADMLWERWQDEQSSSSSRGMWPFRRKQATQTTQAIIP
ncbi:hypothetical protein [Saccharothrix texasensis]|uniref:Uncharacterized protein n=1 Tax=Saccharothrix texasensis TaxID=103734 RepID=A0A3N1H4J9_9PSEU|nr:hypothetical protein [Saccharothrix texasensis]ROP37437.1 hypothetical protein EDD40_2750 [Saccharothrix texasensis]